MDRGWTGEVVDPGVIGYVDRGVDGHVWTAVCGQGAVDRGDVDRRKCVQGV